MIASIKSGTTFSYWTVRYSSLAGAFLTASGRTSCKSCADTPAYLVSVLRPSSPAISLCL